MKNSDFPISQRVKQKLHFGKPAMWARFRKTKQWIKFHYSKFETKIEVWRIRELKKKNKKQKSKILKQPWKI